MPDQTFTSSTTNVLSSTVVTSTSTDLGNIFCFSVSCPNTGSTVPSGPQYVPGTICTIYSSGGTEIGNPGVINGSGDSPGTLGKGQAAVYVSVYWDSVFNYTHWVQLYRGNA